MFTQSEILTSVCMSLPIITISYIIAFHQYTLFIQNFVDYLVLHNYIDLSKNPILKNNNKEIVNRLTSSTHAIFVSALSLLFWKDNNIIIYSLTNNEIDPVVYICIDVMIAYLVYDTIMDTIWKIFDISGIQMLIHHSLGLYSLTMIRYYNTVPAMYYLMMVFLAEISTPFLHASWIMYQLNLTKSIAYKIIGWSLFTTFFIFRIALPPFIIVKLWQEKYIWIDNLHGIFSILFIITLLFTILNYIWFNRLVKMVLNHYKKD